MKRDMQDVYAFWNRIDEANMGSLKDLCDASGVDYAKVRQNRTAMRYMSCLETLAISRTLGVTMEYLLTGSNIRPESQGDRLYRALLEQAPAVLQGLIETYIEKRGTSSASRTV